MFFKLSNFSAIAAVALVALFSPPVSANPTTGKAMSWQGYPGLPNGAGVRVGCFNNCDAYQGDMALAKKLPILCIIPGNSIVPAAYATYAAGIRPNDWGFYLGWSGGRIGLTKPVAGTGLTSLAVANAMCDKKYPGSRMAEHHDNRSGGWSLGAEMIPNTLMQGALKGKSKQRFWVYINDQPAANPW